MATLTTEDEGKFLVDSEGEQLGVITAVDDGTAYVEPDPSIPEAIIQAFGWGDADADDLEVPPAAVDTVTDEEVRVSRDL
ncbi:hypothetical protein [Halobacterium zhouii]|uniref:hypothetical protein n=1 Tax=Halobacterium zhouii TaxID=2902624 RepID=UPI001E3693FE|nr:hypothetical protein [Halobacterium zhouii]